MGSCPNTYMGTPVALHLGMSTLEQLLANNTGSLLTVSNETTLREACAYFIEYGVGSFLVEDEHSICGIFTERDINGAIADGFEIDDTTVEEVMSGSVMIGRLSESVVDAMRAMVKARIHHLPVVDRSEVVGLVSLTDLVREVYGTEAPAVEYLEDDACPTCGTIKVSESPAEAPSVSTYHRHAHHHGMVAA